MEVGYNPYSIVTRKMYCFSNNRLVVVVRYDAYNISSLLHMVFLDQTRMTRCIIAAECTQKWQKGGFLFRQ